MLLAKVPFFTTNFCSADRNKLTSIFCNPQYIAVPHTLHQGTPLYQSCFQRLYWDISQFFCSPGLHSKVVLCLLKELEEVTIRQVAPVCILPMFRPRAPNVNANMNEIMNKQWKVDNIGLPHVDFIHLIEDMEQNVPIVSPVLGSASISWLNWMLHIKSHLTLEQVRTILKTMSTLQVSFLLFGAAIYFCTLWRYDQILLPLWVYHRIWLLRNKRSMGRSCPFEWFHRTPCWSILQCSEFWGLCKLQCVDVPSSASRRILRVTSGNYLQVSGLQHIANAISILHEVFHERQFQAWRHTIPCANDSKHINRPCPLDCQRSWTCALLQILNLCA